MGHDHRVNIVACAFDARELMTTAAPAFVSVRAMSRGIFVAPVTSATSDFQIAAALKYSMYCHLKIPTAKRTSGPMRQRRGRVPINSIARGNS
jgi:hypothetical protein